MSRDRLYSLSAYESKKFLFQCTLVKIDLHFLNTSDGRQSLSVTVCIIHAETNGKVLPGYPQVQIVDSRGVQGNEHIGNDAPATVKHFA